MWQSKLSQVLYPDWALSAITLGFCPTLEKQGFFQANWVNSHTIDYFVIIEARNLWTKRETPDSWAWLDIGRGSKSPKEDLHFVPKLPNRLWLPIINLVRSHGLKKKRNQSLVAVTFLCIYLGIYVKSLLWVFRFVYWKQQHCTDLSKKLSSDTILFLFSSPFEIRKIGAILEHQLSYQAS